MVIGQVVAVATAPTAMQAVLPAIWSGFRVVGGPGAPSDPTSATGAQNAVLLGLVVLTLITIIKVSGVGPGRGQHHGRTTVGVDGQHDHQGYTVALADASPDLLDLARAAARHGDSPTTWGSARVERLLAPAAEKAVPP